MYIERERDREREMCLSVFVYTCVYVYIYIYNVCVYIYIYITYNIPYVSPLPRGLVCVSMDFMCRFMIEFFTTFHVIWGFDCISSRTILSEEKRP